MILLAAVTPFLVLPFRRELFRAAGRDEWVLIALLIVAPALISVLLIGFIDRFGKIRFRWISFVACAGLLAATSAGLGVLSAHSVRVQIVLHEVESGGALGFVRPSQTRYYARNPALAGSLLRNARVYASMVESYGRTQEKSARGWHDSVEDAPLLFAMHLAQGRAPEAILETEVGRRIATMTLVAEAYGLDSTELIDRLVKRQTPAGTFRIGLVTPEGARSLARRLLESPNPKPEALRRVVIAALEHPDLITPDEVVRALEAYRDAQFTSAEAKARFDRVLALRGRLAERFSTPKVAAKIVVSGDQLTNLRRYGEKTARWLLHSAGVQVEDGAEVTLRVYFDAKGKTDEDSVYLQLVMGDEAKAAPELNSLNLTRHKGGSLPGIPADLQKVLKKAGTSVVPSGELFPAEFEKGGVKKFPLLLEEADRAGWLYGLPLYMVDSVPTTRS